MSKGDSLIIKEVVDNCKERFGGNLISVVLFGSRAKGTARSKQRISFLPSLLPGMKRRNEIHYFTENAASITIV